MGNNFKYQIGGCGCGCGVECCSITDNCTGSDVQSYVDRYFQFNSGGYVFILEKQIYESSDQSSYKRISGARLNTSTVTQGTRITNTGYLKDLLAKPYDVNRFFIGSGDCFFDNYGYSAIQSSNNIEKINDYNFNEDSVYDIIASKSTTFQEEDTILVHPKCSLSLNAYLKTVEAGTVSTTFYPKHGGSTQTFSGNAPNFSNTTQITISNVRESGIPSYLDPYRTYQNVIDVSFDLSIVHYIGIPSFYSGYKFASSTSRENVEYRFLKLNPRSITQDRLKRCFCVANSKRDVIADIPVPTGYGYTADNLYLKDINGEYHPYTGIDQFECIGDFGDNFNIPNILADEAGAISLDSGSIELNCECLYSISFGNAANITFDQLKNFLENSTITGKIWYSVIVNCIDSNTTKTNFGKCNGFN